MAQLAIWLHNLSGGRGVSPPQASLLLASLASAQEPSTGVQVSLLHCLQVSTLHHNLAAAQRQLRGLQGELAQREQHLQALSRDHHQLLAKYTQLSEVVGEARLRLNAAAVLTNKTLTEDHAKVGASTFLRGPGSVMMSLRARRGSFKEIREPCWQCQGTCCVHLAGYQVEVRGPWAASALIELAGWAGI